LLHRSKFTPLSLSAHLRIAEAFLVFFLTRFFRDFPEVLKRDAPSP